MSLLVQITLILGLALCIQQLAQRFQLVTILGYLVTGILIGSSGLGIIDIWGNWQSISQLVLCIFALYLGLQVKPQSIWDLRKYIFPKAISTVLILMLCFASAAYFSLSLSASLSLIIGLILALPSHLMIQATLQKHQQCAGRLNQQHAVITLTSVLCLIPAIAGIQLYSGANTLYHALAYSMLLVATLSGLLLFSRYAMQPMLRHLCAKQPQLLFSAAIALVLAVIALSQSLGIHIVLASLLAGMLLSDSEYRAELQQNLKPIQPIILAALWIVLGASLSLHSVIEQFDLILYTVLALVTIKAMVYLALSKWLNNTWQQQLRLTALCGQMGELSFLLLLLLKQEQLIDLAHYQLILATLVGSMLLTPILHYAALHPWKKKTDPTNEHIAEDALALEPHSKLIIAGFGRVGQLIARVAHSQQHAFTAIDNSIEDAEFIYQYAGQMIYGDACETAVLKQAGIEHAELFVLAIDDIEDSLNVARYLRLNFPNLSVLARARDRHHAHLLKDLGIEYIWRESYASSLEMAYRMLCDLGITQQQARAGIQHFLQHDEQLLKEQNALQDSGMKAYMQFDNPMHELEHLFEQDLKLIQLFEDHLSEVTPVQPDAA
jgi:glutathione-regulated potassium-efflux system protein KefB